MDGAIEGTGLEMDTPRKREAFILGCLAGPSAGGPSSGGAGGPRGFQPQLCAFNGIPLQGSVEIVDVGADIDVTVVDFGADLNVQEVDFGASSCGMWQFVDFGGDFSVTFVDFGGDLDIRFVDFGAGT